MPVSRLHACPNHGPWWLLHEGSDVSIAPRALEQSAAKKTEREDEPGLSSVDEIKSGSVGVFELIQKERARTHTEPKSAFMRLMVSRG